MKSPDDGSYATCGSFTSHPEVPADWIRALIPNEVIRLPVRLYTNTALFTASTTSLAPAAMLGSRRVTQGFRTGRRDGRQLAAPANAVSCVGPGERRV